MNPFPLYDQNPINTQLQLGERDTIPNRLPCPVNLNDFAAFSAGEQQMSLRQRNHFMDIPVRWDLTQDFSVKY